MKNNVFVLCYDELEKWADRKKAQAFYLRGMGACDGQEKERYAEVYYQLAEGYDCVDDGYSNVHRLTFTLGDISKEEKAMIAKEYHLDKKTMKSLNQEYLEALYS